MESSFDWGTYQKATEMGEYYWLTHTANRRMFQFIPRRAFESSQHEAAFRELIEQKLGPIENRTRRVKVYFPLLQVAGILFLSLLMLGFLIALVSRIW